MNQKTKLFYIIFGLVIWFIFMILSFGILPISYNNIWLTLIGTNMIIVSLIFFFISIYNTKKYVDNKNNNSN